MLCCCLSSATLLLACVVRLLQGLPCILIWRLSGPELDTEFRRNRVLDGPAARRSRGLDTSVS